ncbi:hypothetical protein J2TS6_51020 [Paenibacillus albilobatus]|uniref:Uncharacterized protein n=1 Tax=Paenibacillus albilobatus TaxID=2716884 RepID=A0A919XKM7_9BACL|nr:hypothetical protein J2TS6_51020 [Paenibacillus albilobatus]
MPGPVPPPLSETATQAVDGFRQNPIPHDPNGRRDAFADKQDLALKA